MVKCGELPCAISNIAKNLHKSVNSISTSRAQLINKGIIYSVKYWTNISNGVMNAVDILFFGKVGWLYRHGLKNFVSICRNLY